MKPAVVLDASALLAALFAETGHELVTSLLGGAEISAVNYSEVLSLQIRMGATNELATANLRVSLGPSSSLFSSVLLVLQPFAPAALPAFFATTASADFSPLSQAGDLPR